MPWPASPTRTTSLRRFGCEIRRRGIQVLNAHRLTPRSFLPQQLLSLLPLNSLRMLFGLAIAIGALLPHVSVWAQSPQTPTPSNLEQYLERLALDDLLDLHLGDQFTAAQTAADKELIGRRIVALHARQLGSGELSGDSLERSLDQLELVLQQVGQLRTDELDAVVIQARHQQAYELAVAWWENPSDNQARINAASALAGLEPRFAEQLARLKESEDKLQADLDNERREDESDRIIEAMGVVRTAYLRTLFYASWNDLYWSTTQTDVAQRAETCARAVARLSEFLEFDMERDGEAMDAESLALDVPLRARAALAMSLVERVRGDDPLADRWLSALDDELVAPEIRAEKEGESVLIALVVDRPTAALNLIAPKVDRMHAPAAVPQVRLGRTLARHGELRWAAGLPQADELRAMGYEILVRLRQFTLIDDLRAEFSSPPVRPHNFWLGWLVGHHQLAIAETTGNPEDFAQAAQLLAEARDMSGARSHLPSLGRLLFELGWAKYRSNQWSEATADLSQASDLLRTDDRDLAVEAAWLRALCFQQLAQSDPTQLDQAVSALQQISISYADHPKAAEARYLLARLQRQTGSSTRSIAALEAIPADDPNYVLARYELVTLKFDAWKNAAEADQANAYQALVNEANRFASLAVDDEFRDKRLRCFLLAAEASLASKRPTETERYLDQARGLSGQLSANHPSVSQYHFLLMQHHLANEQTASALTEARWLAEQADNPNYRKSGLVYVTRDLESRWEAADSETRKSLSAQAVPAYRTLVSLLGSDPATLRDERNARIAMQRLGIHSLNAGEHAEALRCYQSLAEVFPDDTTVLRHQGLAAYALQDWEVAMEAWGRLAAGLRSGSEPWFEARYYEIDCLRRVRPDDARKVWQQFRLLHPEVPFAQWRDRYATLAQNLGG